MPTNPTTKSQVQAYRFMLRRMESALVRKDAVMLHEPMRSHLRASAVGVIVGMLGLAAFFVVGLLSPTSVVEPGDIVVGKQTGAIFVVQDGDPKTLVPVLNLTSARLLVAAFEPGQEAPETKFVEDSALAGIHRKPITGLPGAPASPPDQEKLIDGDWSVCDTATVREDLPDAESRPELSTTVIIGVQRPGQQLRMDQALLVEEESTGADYLVWNGRRLPVNLQDEAVILAYRLGGEVPRKVSAGLLNAIPEGDKLTPPNIPGVGTLTQFEQLSGVQVGDVVQIELAGEKKSYFLVLEQGRQRVPPAVADLIRFDRSVDETFRTFAPEVIREVPEARSQHDFSDFPGEVPEVLGITQTPNACLVWQGTGKDPVITVGADGVLPSSEGVEIPGAVSGQADRVFLEPGKGALVRGVVPSQRPDTGQIWLVTDQGLRYAVPSIEVAKALRLGDQTTPAPQSILGLLKIGPVLDPRQAMLLFDPDLARQQDGG